MSVFPLCVRDRRDSSGFNQAYSSILAIIDVAVPGVYGEIASFHLASILLTSWATFVYRDVWPLCTFTLTPEDAQEGWVIWAKVVTLTIAGVVIPVVTPKIYVPLDPKVRTPRVLVSRHCQKC